MTIQRYLRNTIDVDQTILCLRQILSNTPFQTPRACDPANSSTNPASETLSTPSRTPGNTAHDQAPKRRENSDAPLVTENIILEIRDIMTREYKEENRGCAYVYRDCKDESQYFKIGSTDRIQVRERELQNQCKHIGWELIPEPKLPIWQYKRLERLAQSELKGLRYDLNCVCSIKHREYFRGSNATASEVLERWSRWLVNHEPYDNKKRLKPFWMQRLETFTTNKNGLLYFDCHGNKCARRESKSIVCQECLRAGWKAWTEPTILEKVRYSCRPYIQTLGQHSPVPTYLLGIVGGRIFVPMLLVLLQGYEVSVKTLLDFSICICLLLCYYTRDGGFKGSNSTSSPGKKTSTGQLPRTPDTKSSRHGQYSGCGMKRKFKQTRGDDTESPESLSDSDNRRTTPRHVGLDQNIPSRTLSTESTGPRLIIIPKQKTRRRKSDIY
ncbi:hypothetical protein ASPCADRAFT_204606 [Aspergillus carbonarius ITEM 5010]|uniref:Bacteriophage T5 Orf172 DNA-binding domain-containing protein n=1 Tax=Aspergillus carbonarius (strain ITEM 5010) TaxID=602072 RepID=A0A1R3RWQ1_ASPC5|nr:hypothetical protein ASPCADRAFT_204606 [Aspergillus carbonarius ITEM 5010]